MEQQHNQGQPPYSADDEIDLFELVETVWKGKWIIVAVVCLSLLVAGAVVWWIKPVYKSTVTFLPPVEIDLQEMNKLGAISNNNPVNTIRFQVFLPDKVFQLFVDNLTSRELFFELFESHDLYTIYAPNIRNLQNDSQMLALQRAIDRFSEDFALGQPGRNYTTQEHTLSLSSSLTPEKVALILDDLYEKAYLKTVSDIYVALNSELKIKVGQLKNNISVMRKAAHDRRLDRIAQLDESISIARSLNLADPREVGPDMNLQGVSNQGLPLYSLGYRFLEAERDALIQRKSDDPYIPALRNIQELISTLEEVSIDPEQFTVVRLRQSALPERNPEKPKPMLMFALASVAGLMLGVMIVLVRQAIINRRERSFVKTQTGADTTE